MRIVSFHTMLCFTCREQITVPMRFFGGLAILLAGVAQTVRAQDNAAVPAAPEAAIDHTTPASDLRFSVVWNSQQGSYTYVPEKWGELHLIVVNSLNAPREILCATYFDEQPNLQFGRRILLPARSKLRISHPVLIPQYDKSKGRSIDLSSLVIDSSSTAEVLVKNEAGQLVHDGAMLITHTPRNTGIIAGSNANETVSPDVMNLVIASRVNQRLNNKVTVLGDPFLPADETSLSYLDHIVIVENRLADDFAALSALRRWLHAGGHLWIMLDRVDPLILERLFGDDFMGYVVDHVGLTSVRIDKCPTLANPNGESDEIVDYDDPVEMARVVVHDMDVSFTVNGWPAAMTKQYGQGRVLITTLGSRGWMKPRSFDRFKLDDPLLDSEFIPHRSMSVLASDLFRQREPDLLSQDGMESLVREYIGYSIPSWGLIVGTLFCFLLSLIAVGIWLLRSERLEHLGWIGSVLAVAVSILLLMIGRSYRHRVPGTIASVQIAQALAGTDDVRTQGMIAAYHPEGSRSPIQATRGGWMWPDMAGFESSHRRIVTTDLGEFHWENLVQTPGLRVSRMTTSAIELNRLEAHATLNASGLIGSIAGRLAGGTDAMVGTQSGRIGVNLGDDGSFTALAKDVFDEDQYLSASFLSDEQTRRKRTLEKLLSNPNRKDYPERPQLMFWSDRWENGFQFGDNLKRQNVSLVTVPLIINRPPNGTEILVPAPLLTCRNRTSPDGAPPSAAWDDVRRVWQERSAPMSTWLSFQVPRELVPLTAQKARIDVKVSGPVGRLEIKGLKKGVITSLQTVMDPVGSLSFEINDAEILSISDNGQLTLGISAGDPARPELTGTTSRVDAAAGSTNKTGPAVASIDADAKVNYWKIQSLTLQLWAKTTEPTAKD